MWTWGPVVAWMAMTFIVSHQPAVVIPFGAPDYAAHAINYGVLAALIVRARAGSVAAMRAPLIVSAVVLAVLYGISDEFHQSFIPGRDASVRDVIADAVGATLGACAAAAVGTLRRRRGDRRKYGAIED